MYLALTDLFRAKWTDAIHEEWLVMHLIDLAPNLVCSAAKKQRESLKNLPFECGRVPLLS
jgi:hypothetical protein